MLYPKRKSINKISETKKSRAQFDSEQKAILKVRCGGRCEECGVSLLEMGGDRDHLFGRTGTGARLGWPVCDLAALAAVLCRQCHDSRPMDAGMEYRLRSLALIRFADYLGVPFEGDEDQIAAVRRMWRNAEARGWTADHSLEGKRP